MSSIAPEIRAKIMEVLQNEEKKTDLDNLAVLSRVGMKVASSTSSEIDADATSASSTALIDLGLRLSEATAHGALTEIILHNSSGYCILQAINDDYIVFGGLKNIFRIGYYLGYLRELARKLNLLITGTEITEMALSLEESERAKFRKEYEIEEEKAIIKPSVEQDKAALDDLLGFLDDWEKEGVEFEKLEADTENRIVSIPETVKESVKASTIESQAVAPQYAEKQEISPSFKVYDDEIPPVPLSDYTPMEIEEDESVQEPEIVEEVKPTEELPPLDELIPPDFDVDFIGTASEYETEFVLDQESETFEQVLKELGWDEEE
ncbi:MAG: hypothetical protein ACTSUX_08560 [Promethearchaeota archaeon]